MIQVSGLGVSYGIETALKDVNLNIPVYSACAVIGPSGCGKTTLLYTLAGLLPPCEGQVLINGEVLRGIRKETGVILQHGGLLPWKTVFKNVALGLRSRGKDKEVIDQKVSSILTELGIFEHRNKYPAQLSGGQKQRAAIARTLVLEPDLLLIDEASSSLDTITREHLQDLILRLYKKRPMTMVVVTHSIEEAIFLGRKIVVMERAHIKHIIDNPLFGDENLRSKEEYYRLCLDLRKLLDGGEAE